MPRERRKPKALTDFGGDHGTGTLAAKAGTKLEPITNEDGTNPNKMARRQRISQIDRMSKNMSMRQTQAARAVQDAYCRVEKLSSGSELKEQVDGTSKPDRVIASQVDAQSHLQFVMSAVPKAMRYVVEHVCWYNHPIYTADKGQRHGSAKANLLVALDLVANKLRY